jgi:hypothetical protein
MQNSGKKSERGFVALVSALVISAILITLTFSVSSSSFYARFDALGGENKRISLGLAESCINVALLALATSTAPTTYTPVNLVVHVGEDFQGRPMTCTIQSVTHNGSVATIDVQAQWLGSFSNVTARATIPDPAVGNATPPPTCALTASPSVVPQGQNVLLQWGTLNASSFSLDHGIGNQSGVGSGSHPLVASGVGSVTYVGTVSGPGGSSQCSATFTVSPPPPNPSCADTMMIFDRSGSLNANDRANVKAAANQLIDLYDGVALFDPKIGAGFFGARANANSAEIPTDSPNHGLLSTNYSNLKATVANLIDSTLGINGSNLGEGIRIGYSELGSERHDLSRQKVLIFVSDGEPNRATADATCAMTDPAESLLCRADVAKLPGNDVAIFTVQYTHQTNASTAATARALLAQVATGTVSYPGHLKGSDDNSIRSTETDWKNPSATHTPNAWTGGNFALSTDTTYATDSIAANQQGFSNFGVSIPAGSTIHGIEARITGKLSTVANVDSSRLSPGNVGNYASWVASGGSATTAVVYSATPDEDASYITSASQTASHTFVMPSSNVPAGSTINSVKVVARARTSSGSAMLSIRAELGTAAGQQSDGAASPNPLPSAYANYERIMTTNPFTGSAWTDAEVNAWTTRFGVAKTSAGTVRVTQFYVIVNYTPAPVSSCTVGVDFSWNDGGSWSTQKNAILTSGEAALAPVGNSASDTWGRSWSINDVANGNLVMRITNGTCTGSTVANVNSVSLKIHYTGFDADYENNDGDAFFITPDTSNPDAIRNIFETIGRKVCKAAAAKCANGVDDDGDGAIDSSDPQCHTDGNALNSASYSATINDEYQPPPPPPPPSAPPPPPPVSIGTWQEIPH